MNDENQIVSMIYELQNMLVARGYDRSPSLSRNLSADHISISSSTSGTEEQKLQVCENLVYTIAGITCILRIDKVCVIQFRCFVGTTDLLLQFIQCF